MSPRTYIGPFGRILPVPDDKDPGPQQLPDSAIDETRHNMATYQLPPPERLHFGTDMSCGFTEPMRYNTISQSNRTHVPNYQSLVEPSRHIRHEQLPSVSQLLTPSKQSNASSPSTYEPERPPNPPQRPPTVVSQNRDPSSDQALRAPRYARHTNYPQPPATAQTQSQVNVNPSGEKYQISSATQRLNSYSNHNGSNISPYASSFESNQQPPQASHLQQVAPSLIPHQQQTNPSITSYPQSIPLLGASQPQHVQPFNTAAPYFPGQTSAYQGAISPAIHPDSSPPAPSNTVKPQPRVVAERDIPGEGPCWVYEDGSTCKKVIDGELVNAQWGVTKAGKPRKRLAIACTTCREKKIKCDPAEPKCVQCEKFGRECKFMTA